MGPQRLLPRFKLYKGGSTKIPSSPSSSSLPVSRNIESVHVTGRTSTSVDPSSSTQSGTTTNIILFGETGVGKSSVINLIARQAVAKVSSDVNGCTMESTPYYISFGGMNLTIFDTIGLEEPEMGVNGYLKAIEKAFDLITKLEAAGGIHLLLFCMRGGRITATTQSNYRMFYECLCHRKVPIALVFTGLEREVDMENWWRRNENYIRQYGIKSQGHACITAVNDGTPEEEVKYTESQSKIRELITHCALESAAPLPEPHSWLAKFAQGMMTFIKKRADPGRKKLLKTLTQRCHLAMDVAEKIMDMMENNDQEPNENEAVHVQKGEVESKHDSSAGVATSAHETNTIDVQKEVESKHDSSTGVATSAHETNTIDVQKEVENKSDSSPGAVASTHETETVVKQKGKVESKLDLSTGAAVSTHKTETVDKQRGGAEDKPGSSAGAAASTRETQAVGLQKGGVEDRPDSSTGAAASAHETETVGKQKGGVKGKPKSSAGAAGSIHPGAVSETTSMIRDDIATESRVAQKGNTGHTPNVDSTSRGTRPPVEDERSTGGGPNPRDFAKAHTRIVDLELTREIGAVSNHKTTVRQSASEASWQAGDEGDIGVEAVKPGAAQNEHGWHGRASLSVESKHKPQAISPLAHSHSTGGVTPPAVSKRNASARFEPEKEDSLIGSERPSKPVASQASPYPESRSHDPPSSASQGSAAGSAGDRVATDENKFHPGPASGATMKGSAIGATRNVASDATSRCEQGNVKGRFNGSDSSTGSILVPQGQAPASDQVPKYQTPKFHAPGPLKDDLVPRFAEVKDAEQSKGKSGQGGSSSVLFPESGPRTRGPTAIPKGVPNQDHLNIPGPLGNHASTQARLPKSVHPGDKEGQGSSHPTRTAPTENCKPPNSRTREELPPPRETRKLMPGGYGF